MIKILENSKPFIKICDKCGCKFQYELEDIDDTTPMYRIKCPTCGTFLNHIICTDDKPTYPNLENIPYIPTMPLQDHIIYDPWRWDYRYSSTHSNNTINTTESTTLTGTNKE